jgi:hypothetical protein
MGEMMIKLIDMLLSMFRNHNEDNSKVPVEKRRCVWDLEKEC